MELLRFKLASFFKKLGVTSLAKMLYRSLLHSSYEVVVRKSANNLSMILDEQGKYEESIELLENTLKKIRTNDLIFDLSVSYSKINSIDKERELLNEIIATNETSDRYYFLAVLNLVETYIDQNDIRRAYNLCRENESLFSNEIKFLYNYGLVLGYMGRYDEAIVKFKYALFLNDNDVDTNSNLGLIYWKRRDFEQAIRYYRKALKLAKTKKDKASKYYGLAACYDEMGKKDEAIKLLKKSSKWGYEKAKEGLLELEKEKVEDVSVSGK